MLFISGCSSEDTPSEASQEVKFKMTRQEDIIDEEILSKLDYGWKVPLGRAVRKPWSHWVGSERSGHPGFSFIPYALAIAAAMLNSQATRDDLEERLIDIEIALEDKELERKEAMEEVERLESDIKAFKMRPKQEEEAKCAEKELHQIQDRKSKTHGQPTLEDEKREMKALAQSINLEVVREESETRDRCIISFEKEREKLSGLSREIKELEKEQFELKAKLSTLDVELISDPVKAISNLKSVYDLFLPNYQQMSKDFVAVKRMLVSSLSLDLKIMVGYMTVSLKR